MLDSPKMQTATQNLRDAIQDAESKLKISVTQDGFIPADCLIDLFGTLKSEMLSMKLDVAVCRAVIYAQNKVLSTDEDIGNTISDIASAYLDSATEKVKKDSAEREKNKSRIITATNIPT